MTPGRLFRLLEPSMPYKDPEAAKVRGKAYRAANKDKLAARAKAHREANPERAAARVKAWYKANKDRHAANHKAWVAANKDSHAAYKKAWHEANKERLKDIRAAYFRANKEALTAAQKAWNEANKELVRGYGEAYRATPRGRDGARTRLALRRVLKSTACPAWVDRKAIEEIYASCPPDHHIDHISPLKGRQWRGEWQPGDSLLWLLELPDGAEDIFGNPISTRVSIGLHVPLNLMPLPDEENLSKSNQAPQPGYMDWFGHSLVNGLHV